MKKNLSALFVCLCLLHCGCVCHAATAEDWAQKWDAAVSDSTVIALSPGADASEIRFSWLCDLTARNEFELSASPDFTSAQPLTVEEKLTLTGQKVCRVKAENLQSGTEYFYRYTKNGAWSDVYSFRTAGDTLTALFVTDAQLGRSGDWRSKDVLLHDVAGWDTTLTKATEDYPDISLILSGGDQAEKGFSEQEYRLLLAPDTLRSIPIAPVVGNHEFYFPYLNLHFSLPNRFSGSIIHSLGDEPYYFEKNGVLFIQLESNDLFAFDHEAVLDRAVRQYPDATWRVVTMHHSLYSSENTPEKGPTLRKPLTNLFQKYGIDLVLSGHTHRYSRTYPLWDGKESDNGIVYLEGGCSSACNSKASREDLPAYAAAGYPISGNAVYTVLTFGDDSIQVTSFAVEDGERVQIDEATVCKNTRSDPENAHMSPLARISQALLSVCGRLVSVLFS